jgi:hypothetical protein
MENAQNLSLKNRRTLVVVFFITLVIAFAVIPYTSEPPPKSFLWLIPLGFLIVNTIIVFYLKSRSDIFNIGGHDPKIDERLYIIRLKAQRDAYYFIISTVMVTLPIGYHFFQNDTFLFVIYVVCYMVFLSSYLPIMLIAWQEKEV